MNLFEVPVEQRLRHLLRNHRRHWERQGQHGRVLRPYLPQRRQQEWQGQPGRPLRGLCAATLLGNNLGYSYNYTAEIAHTAGFTSAAAAHQDRHPQEW